MLSGKREPMHRANGMMQSCLDENLILAFLQGKTSAAESALFEAHVESCGACRELLVVLFRENAGSAREGMPGPVDLPGTDGRPMINGRYSVRGECGRGGQARVLLAHDHTMGRDVALKELLPELDPVGTEVIAPDQQPWRAAARFLREARITGNLDHPCVVPVYEIGQREDGRHYYTMKRVEGITLHEAIARCDGLTDRLRLLGHIEDLGQALSYAHSRGVLHRDVKPQNVVIGEFGETVLLDWGLATSTENEEPRIGPSADLDEPEVVRVASRLVPETVPGTIVGTPAYMSPEQAAGRVSAYDERTDVYGLGAVLYEVLTGRAPFRDSRASELMDAIRAGKLAPVKKWCPEVDSELAAIAEKALAKVPEERYQHATEMVRDLSAYLTGHRVGAHHYSTWDLIRLFVRQHRVVLVTVTAFLLVILGALITVGLAWRSESQSRRMAQYQRKTAVDALGHARSNHAQAQREAARSALLAGRVLEARARLRRSLETQDTVPARALWWRLRLRPLIWKRRLTGAGLSVAISPDGQTVAAASHDGTIQLFNIHTAGARVLRGHRSGVRSIAYSPDGAWLATGTWEGKVGLWDLSRAKLKWVRPHPGRVRVVRFSKGGTLIASGSTRGTARLWRASSGDLAVEIRAHVGAVGGVAFGQRDEWLATGGTDKQIRIWRLGDLLGRSNQRPRRPPPKAARGGSASMVLASPVSAAQEAIPQSTRGLSKVLRANTAVLALAFLPLGDQLVSGGADHTVRLWHLSTGQRRVFRGHAGPVYGVSISRDGRWLLSASHDGTIRRWQMSSGNQQGVFRGHQSEVLSAQLDPQAARFASCGMDGTVRLWRIQPTRQPLPQAPDSFSGVSFSPQGKQFAAGSGDGRLWIWDTDSPVPRHVLKGHAGDTIAVHWSPQGRRIATSNSDKTVRVWDPVRGRSLLVLQGHRGVVYDVRFSPDGRNIASASDDGSVRLWDGATGALLRVFHGQMGGLQSVAFSPDGKSLAAGGREIRIWSSRTGQLLHRLKGHSGRCYGLRFGRTAQQLVSGCTDGRVRLWDIRRGTHRVVGRHPKRVFRLSVHPHGQLIGASDSHGVARIWNIRGGRPTLLRGHRGEVNDLAFSPSGKLAVTAGDDQTVRVWHTHSGEPYWRGFLVPSLAGVHLGSHRGWKKLSASTRATHAPRWQKVIATQARGISTAASWLCLHTRDGRVLGWDLQRDEQRLTQRINGVTQIVALHGRCVSLARGTAWLHKPRQPPMKLAANAKLLARSAKELLVVTPGKLLSFGAGGTPLAPQAISSGVTAVARTAHWTLLGFRDGNVELVPRQPGRARPSFAFEAVPGSPVVSLRVGPRQTLAIGHANGQVGLWSLSTGERLRHHRLQGPVSSLYLDHSTMYAVSALGDAVVWDLNVLNRSYCSLMREVWQSVRVYWANGRPQFQKAPMAHPCYQRASARKPAFDTQPPR